MSDWRETIYGNCPIHWDIKELIDISKLITDGSHFSPKPQAFGKMMCSVKDMRYNKFDFSDVKYINQNDYEKLVDQGCKPLLNDLLISKDGANCLDILFINKQREDFVLLSSIAIVRLQDTVFPEYIMYFLLSPQVQYILRTNFISGSAIPRVVLKDFKKVNILLPPLLEQRAIASVLSSLDDKIDLLHRQNKTLEAMAETLFRQWFVEEADEGWEEEIGNLPIEIIDGDRGANYPNSKELLVNGYCLFLSAQNVTQNGFNFANCSFISREKDELLNKGKLKKNDIVLTTRGTVGNIAYYQDQIPFDNIRINSGMVIFRTIESKLPVLFLYILMKTTVFSQKIQEHVSGSAQPQLPIKDIRKMKIVNPAKEIVNEYLEIVRPLYKNIFHNDKQISVLEKLRDTLLPKLLSGEVRVGL